MICLRQKGLNYRNRVKILGNLIFAQDVIKGICLFLTCLGSTYFQYGFHDDFICAQIVDKARGSVTHFALFIQQISQTGKPGLIVRNFVSWHVFFRFSDL